MGGLLDVAGVPGFLGNTAVLYDTADEESRVWRRFVSEWWKGHSGQPVGVADLFPIVENGDIDLGLGDGNERSQRTRLGKRIAQKRGRHFDRWRIDEVGTLNGSQQWRLSEAGR